jgi:hypothetical protein
MSSKYLYLPYKTQTITNKQLEFNFRLDPNTVSPTTINEIVSLILDKISSEIEIFKPSNGDIIQALCMVLVIRSKMIDYNFEIIEKIVNKTLKNTFNDGKKAKIKEPPSGKS